MGIGLSVSRSIIENIADVCGPRRMMDQELPSCFRIPCAASPIRRRPRSQCCSSRRGDRFIHHATKSYGAALLRVVTRLLLVVNGRTGDPLALRVFNRGGDRAGFAVARYHDGAGGCYLSGLRIFQ
jgi:hypothetical protein